MSPKTLADADNDDAETQWAAAPVMEESRGRTTRRAPRHVERIQA
jgi:hypothetical protein